ncbi:UspA domain protein [Desulfamplus magnetovallimortis]|uniref:UspA domain protein n=1 Tax=Desulfamplus magnetovallimortis TaxID=1246637 RepID=A0A1W1HDN8_9BACT|nr:universal stress protein [Desulfamplus magnetovallimortis]SLM30495.1 UspA domain protein [Desulfamplus magnetovallimortis]
MFKKILFATSATEASDHAARVAFNMATTLKAHINLFHVLGVPTRGFSQVVLDVKTKEKVEIDDEYIKWVEDEVKTYYANQLTDGIDASIKVAVGFPHREILRQAREIEPDLIVMGGSTGDESDSVYKATTGSTLQRVAKAAQCPIMVVNRPAASFWGGMSSIVFGTDFSKASDKAFDFALKAAGELGCEMNIFHALDISSSHMGFTLSQDEIEERIRKAYRVIRSRYVSKMEKKSNFSMDVWEGIPYVEIVKYAREKHADLIIMAHNSRKLDGDAPKIGSNMEQVIVRAGCPVISINR